MLRATECFCDGVHFRLTCWIQLSWGRWDDMAFDYGLIKIDGFLDEVMGVNTRVKYGLQLC